MGVACVDGTAGRVLNAERTGLGVLHRDGWRTDDAEGVVLNTNDGAVRVAPGLTFEEERGTVAVPTTSVEQLGTVPQGAVDSFHDPPPSTPRADTLLTVVGITIVNRWKSSAFATFVKTKFTVAGEPTEAVPPSTVADT